MVNVNTTTGGKLKYASYTLPNQANKYADKLKPEWFMPTCNYIINRCLGADDHSKLEEYFKAARGEVSDAVFKKVLKPLTSDDPTLKNISIGTKRNVDFIKPIVRRYLGEVIKQYTNFQVYTLDPEAVMARNNNLDNEVDKILAQMFVNEMAEQGLGNPNDAQPTPDPEQYIRDAEQKFLNDEVLKQQHRLNLILSETDERTKMIQLFYNWFASNRCVTYSSIRYDDVIYEVIPVEEYFRVDSGNPYIKDDDMGLRRFRLTVNQIIERYRDIIKPADIEYLKEHNSALSNYVTEGTVLTRDIADVYDLTTVLQGGSTLVSTTDFSRPVMCYHAVMKTQREIRTLTYSDMFGHINTIEVSDDYKLDPEHGDISMDKEYQPEFWEFYRFGDQLEGVYSIPQPCELQRHLFNNHAYCENPYNGLYKSLDQFSVEPIPYTISDINVLNMIILIQIERTIAKYRPGLVIIPESLLQDTKEYTTEERLASMVLDDHLIINDEDVNANIMQAIKVLNNNTVEQYIISLFEIRKRLKEEAYDMADMTPSRMGDNSPYAGKATTEMSLNYSIAGSVLLFEKFNKLRERDYERLIDCSRLAWIDGKNGSYSDEQGNITNLLLKPNDNLTNLGVFVRNSAIEVDNLNKLRGMGQAAMQSGDYNIAAKIATGDNSTEIMRYIEDFTQATRKMQQDQHQAELDNQKQINDAQIADKQEERQFEGNLEMFKQNAETERAHIKVGTKDTGDSTAVSVFQQQLGESKQSLAERKQTLAENQLATNRVIANRKLDVEQRKQASAERIARMHKSK